VIRVDYPDLLADMVIGDRVVLGDGAISLSISEVSAGSMLARVETGGRAQGAPGVHLSSERLGLTTPTEEDLVLAEAMASAGVEFIAVSFVRAPSDLEQVRAVVARRLAAWNGDGEASRNARRSPLGSVVSSRSFEPIDR
jgi:pyruvate kinase